MTMIERGVALGIASTLAVSGCSERQPTEQDVKDQASNGVIMATYAIGDMLRPVVKVNGEVECENPGEQIAVDPRAIDSFYVLNTETGTVEMVTAASVKDLEPVSRLGKVTFTSLYCTSFDKTDKFVNGWPVEGYFNNPSDEPGWREVAIKFNGSADEALTVTDEPRNP